MRRIYFLSGITLLLIMISIDLKAEQTLNDSKLLTDNAPAVADAVPIPKLFGTIINANERTAIFDDPVSEITGIYKINDFVAGFLISDIQIDKVILIKGNERIEVGLRDPKGIRSDTLPTINAADKQIQLSRSNNSVGPTRPIPPPGKTLGGMDSMLTSEELLSPEEDANSDYIHPRFLRRSKHESFETPITPPPPIPPTFD